jgi:acetylornithine deacetylase
MSGAAPTPVVTSHTDEVVAATTVPALARALVATPSHDDETAAGDAIEAWLREHLDGAVARDDAGNVLARVGPGSGVDGDDDPAPAPRPTGWAAYGGDGPSLAFVGHHDVVPPADRQVRGDGYVVSERDGRLYGRGSADMKASLAAAMVAVRDASASEEVVFASFVGEEAGGVGARAAIADGFTPDRAVVAEGSTGYSAPGVTDVAVAHKGRRGHTIVATGAGAHASEPDAGVNAVYRASDAVDVVRDLAAPTATVAGESLAGSVVVTGIEGGTAMNVIPERCTVTVDERTVPDGRADLGRVEAIEGVRWRVDDDLPPMACSDPAFADAVLGAARAAHGAAVDHPGDDPGTDADGPALPERVVKPHATDAGWLATAGVACVVCGAAEPGEAHTDRESVSLAVAERCRRTYAGTIERVAGGG